MLQAIRDKVTGWVAYGIIFLISIPFALAGVYSYLGGGEAPPAATVNGEEITLRDLDQAYANYRQRLAQLFGGAIPESLGNETHLREQVLGQLIEEFALRQYIDQQRYRIGDDDLNRIIRNMNVFKTDGKFDTAIYEAQLRSLGYSTLGFEQELRRNGAMEQFQNGIRSTAFSLPVTEQKFNSLNNQTRKIRTLTYSAKRDSIEVEENEILALYETQPDRFRSTEQLRIDYIELSLDSVKQGIEVNREDVLSRYRDTLETYTSLQTRDASHILIKTDDEVSGDAALARITELRERIVGGESFADIAREFSQDPGSAADGGSLGEIEPGVMVQSFEAALYALEIDQLSQPVKTGFGWHLIKLHSVKGGETQPFESVATKLEDEIKTEQAEGQIYDLVEALANMAYEESGSLDPAAEQLGLNLQTSDWFSRISGEGIATEEKIRQIAFSDDVLLQGLNSEAIELGSDRVVFIRLNEHKPAATLPLEVVRAQVKEELIAGKLSEQNMAAGSAGLEGLQTGNSLDDLALGWSSPVIDYGFIDRRHSEIETAVRSSAFRMPRPEQGISFEGLTLNNGDYVIIELSAIVSSDDNSDQEALDSLTEALGGVEYQAALKLLSSRAEIVRTPAEDLGYGGHAGI